LQEKNSRQRVVEVEWCLRLLSWGGGRGTHCCNNT